MSKIVGFQRTFIDGKEVVMQGGGVVGKLEDEGAALAFSDGTGQLGKVKEKPQRLVVESPIVRITPLGMDYETELRNEVVHTLTAPTSELSVPGVLKVMGEVAEYQKEKPEFLMDLFTKPGRDKYLGVGLSKWWAFPVDHPFHPAGMWHDARSLRKGPMTKAEDYFFHRMNRLIAADSRWLKLVAFNCIRVLDIKRSLEWAKERVGL